jgi:predicted small lipoprotein YifL
MQISRPLPCQAITRSLIVTLIAGISLLSAACGLKGPLRLPDDKAQEVKRPQGDAKKRAVTPPAPQSQKQDRIDNAGGTTTTTPPATDPDRPTPPPPGP